MDRLTRCKRVIERLPNGRAPVGIALEEMAQRAETGISEESRIRGLGGRRVQIALRFQMAQERPSGSPEVWQG